MFHALMQGVTLLHETAERRYFALSIGETSSGPLAKVIYSMGSLLQRASGVEHLRPLQAFHFGLYFTLLLNSV